MRVRSCRSKDNQDKTPRLRTFLRPPKSNEKRKENGPNQHVPIRMQGHVMKDIRAFAKREYLLIILVVGNGVIDLRFFLLLGVHDFFRILLGSLHGFFLEGSVGFCRSSRSRRGHDDDSLMYLLAWWKQCNQSMAIKSQESSTNKNRGSKNFMRNRLCVVFQNLNSEATDGPPSDKGSCKIFWLTPMLNQWRAGVASLLYCSLDDSIRKYFDTNALDTVAYCRLHTTR